MLVQTTEICGSPGQWRFLRKAKALAIGFVFAGANQMSVPEHCLAAKHLGRLMHGLVSEEELG